MNTGKPLPLIASAVSGKALPLIAWNYRQTFAAPCGKPLPLTPRNYRQAFAEGIEVLIEKELREALRCALLGRAALRSRRAKSKQSASGSRSVSCS
jgi:hypothetical protein